MAEAQTRRTPGILTGAPATRIILAVTCLVWLTELVPVWSVDRALAYVPTMSWAQPWRALTAAFVHAQPSPLHLLANMVGLVLFGSFVERAAGSAFLVVAYVLSALGGSVITLILTLAGLSPVNAIYVGASGAVFGIVGTLLAPTKRLDRNIGGVLIFLALNAALLVVEPGIAWDAHLGGLLVGIALGCARFIPKPQVTLPNSVPDQRAEDVRSRIASSVPVGLDQVKMQIMGPAGAELAPVPVSEARAVTVFWLTSGVVLAAELTLYCLPTFAAF